MAGKPRTWWENAGPKRHRVDVEQVTESAPNEKGEKEIISSVVATRWASIWPQGDKVVTQSGETAAYSMSQVRMFYGSDIADIAPVTWHLTYKGRTLEIVSVSNLEELGREIELLCQERV